MPKPFGIDSAITFSNLPIFFFILTLIYFLFCKSEKDMEQKPFNGQTNSQVKLNLLKILVYTLTIVMIFGIIIITTIIFKVFFLEPNIQNKKTTLPSLIKIPEKSKLETIEIKNDNITMIISFSDGTQQVIIATLDDGLEISREYIKIDSTN